jgi:high-affinity iron transporter
VSWLVRVLLILVAGVAALTGAAGAAQAETQTWNHVVDDMVVVINKAGTAYRAGDSDSAKDLVNDVYFGYYEKLGFEKTVMAYISGDRAAAVEYQFSQVKKDITAGEPSEQVDSDLAQLAGMLREDANRLDGTAEAPYAVLFQSLLIMLREGFEAILVVGAIVAYLVKSGHREKARAVYVGSVAALVASALLAWLLNSLTILSGANQELIEGFTVLIAVVMLIYVSSWILSKTEGDAWSSYIRRKSDESIRQGSVLTLAFVAFLAVFREGAEMILFYQALMARSAGSTAQLWVGVVIGLVLLAVTYVLIRLLSVRVPLRPFFLGTSFLLAVMAFSFAGTGVKELQAGGLVSASPIGWLRSFDLLGVYPTVETLSAQAAVAIIFVGLYWFGFRKARSAAAAEIRPVASTTTFAQTGPESGSHPVAEVTSQPHHQEISK